MEDNEEPIKSKTKPLWYFGLMTLPMRQWLCYIVPQDYCFASNAGLSFPPDNLKYRTFSIWFCTIIDALEKENHIYETLNELEIEKYQIDITKTHMTNVLEKFKAVASNFTKREQLFLRDRRLQNVHGYLSCYFKKNIAVKWFDAPRGKVIRETITADEYNSIMQEFYPEMASNEDKLIKKFLLSEGGKDLVAYWSSTLRDTKTYLDLIKQMAKELDSQVIESVS
jgi:hypothetical protein